MKILLIEDEVNVASFIKKGFEEDDYSVDVANDGALGLGLACKNKYDLVILDIVLPNLNGIEVCKKIRERLGLLPPVIMLTALGTTDDVVRGLETGADDYLVKPFKFRELLARAKALMRRKNNIVEPKIYKIADLEFNQELKRVTRNKKEIQLTLREFRLLEYLIMNENKILSRVEILENVWDVNFDMGTNVVDVYINYLRNKIDKNFTLKLIQTVVGRGYILKAK